MIAKLVEWFLQACFMFWGFVLFFLFFMGGGGGYTEMAITFHAFIPDLDP